MPAVGIAPGVPQVGLAMWGTFSPVSTRVAPRAPRAPRICKLGSDGTGETREPAEATSTDFLFELIKK